MKILLVLLLGVVGAMADHHECGPLQRLKVKQQWSQAYGVGEHREDFNTAVWRGIFRQDDSARELFTQVGGDDTGSPEFRAHMARVAGGLDLSISLLDQEDVLNVALAHLETQHDPRGVSGYHFGLMKNALLKVIPAAIGRCFDNDAWSACYDVIANAIEGDDTLKVEHH